MNEDYDGEDTWWSDLLGILALLILAVVVRVIELVDPTWLTTERTRDNEGRHDEVDSNREPAG